MKDYLRDLVNTSTTTAGAALLVREYLQARVLEAIQRAGAFEHWAFLGGTALRFLHRLPRFSEDLDFSRTRIEQSHDTLHYDRASLLAGAEPTAPPGVPRTDRDGTG